MGTRAKLTIAYLGGSFSGWQRQDNARTVQGELERCLAKLAGGNRVAVVGAGRTDAGVHAAGQVAHVDLPTAIPVEVLPRALNHRLSADVRVRSAVTATADFHAIRSARGKHYVYRIRWREPDLPWLGARSAVMPALSEPRSLERMCRRLPGRRDWASFTVPEAVRRSTIRTLFRAEVLWRRSGLDLHFFGEGFLRYQVRRMVGALLEVGCGRMSTRRFAGLLLRPSPGASVPTAPAKGLTLERVYYRASEKLSISSPDTGPEEDSSLW
jgi:tRNA pseudouridine38-40 synthase